MPGKIKSLGNKECVTLWPLPFYIEMDLKANEELWKHSKYFIIQKLQSSKKTFRRNQNPSRYY
jgi:hypothetical protein